MNEQPMTGAPDSAAVSGSNAISGSNPDLRRESRQTCPRRLLAFVLLNGIALNLVFLLLTFLLARFGVALQPENTLQPPLEFLRLSPADDDSFMPMASALHFLEAGKAGSPYQAIFFEDRIKFQYPLASLLPFYALQKLGFSDDSLFLILQAACWVAVWAIIGLSILIAFKLLRRDRTGPINWRDRAVIAVAVAVAGLLFYPILRGYELGQIQTLLTAGFSLAFYLWLTGRERAAGAVMGLMSLVKPQYALFLLWAFMRRKLGAFTSALVSAATVFAASCAVFGLRNNLDYLRVLHFIGARGEGFYANQSMNGLLNRLLSNGGNLVWNEMSFAPFNPFVFYGTLMSSLALIGLALFFPWEAARKGGLDDFASFVLAATMASPVAWEHHYGILFPIFIWLYFGQSPGRLSKPRAFLVGLAYVLASNMIAPLTGLASIPALNVFESYVFIGALLVLILLCGTPKKSFHSAPSGPEEFDIA